MHFRVVSHTKRCAPENSFIRDGDGPILLPRPLVGAHQPPPSPGGSSWARRAWDYALCDVSGEWERVEKSVCRDKAEFFSNGLNRPGASAAASFNRAPDAQTRVREIVSAAVAVIHDNSSPRFAQSALGGSEEDCHYYELLTNASAERDAVAVLALLYRSPLGASRRPTVQALVCALFELHRRTLTPPRLAIRLCQTVAADDASRTRDCLMALFGAASRAETPLLHRRAALLACCSIARANPSCTMLVRSIALQHMASQTAQSDREHADVLCALVVWASDQIEHQEQERLGSSQSAFPGFVVSAAALGGRSTPPAAAAILARLVRSAVRRIKARNMKANAPPRAPLSLQTAPLDVAAAAARVCEQLAALPRSVCLPTEEVKLNELRRVRDTMRTWGLVEACECGASIPAPITEAALQWVSVGLPNREGPNQEGPDREGPGSAETVTMNTEIAAASGALILLLCARPISTGTFEVSRLLPVLVRSAVDAPGRTWLLAAMCYAVAEKRASSERRSACKNAARLATLVAAALGGDTKDPSGRGDNDNSVIAARALSPTRWEALSRRLVPHAPEPGTLLIEVLRASERRDSSETDKSEWEKQLFTTALCESMCVLFEAGVVSAPLSRLRDSTISRRISGFITRVTRWIVEGPASGRAAAVALLRHARTLCLVQRTQTDPAVLEDKGGGSGVRSGDGDRSIELTAYRQRGAIAASLRAFVASSFDHAIVEVPLRDRQVYNAAAAAEKLTIQVVSEGRTRRMRLSKPGAPPPAPAQTASRSRSLLHGGTERSRSGPAATGSKATNLGRFVAFGDTASAGNGGSGVGVFGGLSAGGGGAARTPRGKSGGASALAGLSAPRLEPPLVPVDTLRMWLEPSAPLAVAALAAYYCMSYDAGVWRILRGVAAAPAQSVAHAQALVARAVVAADAATYGRGVLGGAALQRVWEFVRGDDQHTFGPGFQREMKQLLRETQPHVLASNATQSPLGLLNVAETKETDVTRRPHATGPPKKRARVSACPRDVLDALPQLLRSEQSASESETKVSNVDASRWYRDFSSCRASQPPQFLADVLHALAIATPGLLPHERSALALRLKNADLIIRRPLIADELLSALLAQGLLSRCKAGPAIVCAMADATTDFINLSSAAYRRLASAWAGGRAGTRGLARYIRGGSSTSTGGVADILGDVSTLVLAQEAAWVQRLLEVAAVYDTGWKCVRSSVSRMLAVADCSGSSSGTRLARAVHRQGYAESLVKFVLRDVPGVATALTGSLGGRVGEPPPAQGATKADIDRCAFGICLVCHVAALNPSSLSACADAEALISCVVTGNGRDTRFSQRWSDWRRVIQRRAVATALVAFARASRSRSAGAIRARVMQIFKRLRHERFAAMAGATGGGDDGPEWAARLMEQSRVLGGRCGGARGVVTTLELNDMCVELLCNTAGHDGEDVIADLEDGGGLDALRELLIEGDE